MKPPKQILCWLLGHSPRGMMSAGVCRRCGTPTGLRYFRDGRKWTDRERYGVIDPLRKLWRRLLIAWPSCDECGCPLVFRRKHYEINSGNTVCSECLVGDDIPF